MSLRVLRLLPAARTEAPEAASKGSERVDVDGELVDLRLQVDGRVADAADAAMERPQRREHRVDDDHVATSSPGREKRRSAGGACGAGGRPRRPTPIASRPMKPPNSSRTIATAGVQR